MNMPFDITPMGGGGGQGDPMTRALLTLVTQLYACGLRPKDFEPGSLEVISIDIQIQVHPSGAGFTLMNASTRRWEQLEIDPDEAEPS